MNVRLVRFSLFSLCMHVVVFGFFGYAGSFEHGAANGIKSEHPELEVRIVEVENMPQPDAIQERVKKELVPDRKLSIEEVSRRPSLRASERPSFIGRLGSPGSPNNMNEPTENKAEAVAMEDYVTAGRLTRPPTPLIGIDLDVPEINEIAFEGKTELAVLIKSNGLVADVIISGETDAARAFGERVAERFRSARFRPGEIGGTAVNSQLQITVVSESPLKSRDQN